jgi:hypothetical protein
MGEYNHEGLIRVLSDMYDVDELVDLMSITPRELIYAFLDKGYILAHSEGITIPESLDLMSDDEYQVDDDADEFDGFHIVDEEEENE